MNVPFSRPLRVLMVNRPHASNLPGGDLVQMHETANELRKLGVEVRISHDLKPDLNNTDLVHAFNLETPASTSIQVARAKAAGLPVALSPIYFDMPDAIRFTNFNTYGRWPLIKRLIGKSLSYKVYRHLHNRLIAEQKKVLQSVDYLLPNSHRERESISSVFPEAKTIPFSVVTNGIRAERFRNGDKKLFEKKYNVTDYLLVVGRIGYLKNQLQLLRALRGWDHPIVLIGQEPDQLYAQACHREAKGRNVLFLPHLSPEEVKNAYAAARVHALPSQKETVGLVSMEAAVADCRIVVSPVGGQKEYFREWAEYCDPNDIGSIRGAVERAWQKPVNTEFVKYLSATHTWDLAAKQTLQAYRAILNR